MERLPEPFASLVVSLGGNEIAPRSTARRIRSQEVQYCVDNKAATVQRSTRVPHLSVGLIDVDQWAIARPISWGESSNMKCNPRTVTSRCGFLSPAATGSSGVVNTRRTGPSFA